jgi:hypothetical protein
VKVRAAKRSRRELEAIFSLDNFAADFPDLPWCPPGYIYTGGYNLPLSTAETPRLYLGQPRSGKSALAKLEALTVLQNIRFGHAQRFFALDPKMEWFDLLTRYLPRESVRYIEPTNVIDGAAYALFDDVESADDAEGIGKLLSPPNPRVENRFFDDARDSILGGLCRAVFMVYGREGRLHHVTAYMLDEDSMKSGLELGGERNRPLVKAHFGKGAKGTNRDVIRTIINSLDELRRAGDGWRRSKRICSIAGFRQGKYALLIGYSHTMPDVTATVTRLVINRMNRQLLAERDIYRPRTFQYLDEYVFFNKLHTLVPTLALASAKGVCASLLVQDEGLQKDVYGPYQTQALSGLCSKFFFRLADPDTAEKASRHCGETERVRVTRSISQTNGEHPTTSFSMAEHFERVRTIPPEYFMSIPLLNPPHVNACGYVGVSPFLGVYLDEVPLHVMQQWLPRPRLSLPELVAATSKEMPVAEGQGDDDEWPDLDSNSGPLGR